MYEYIIIHIHLYTCMKYMCVYVIVIMFIMQAIIGASTSSVCIILCKIIYVGDTIFPPRI